MLDYTKAAIKKTKEDFARIDLIRNVVTQVVYIAYLVYATWTGMGVFWANVTLLSLACAYFGFFLFVTLFTERKKIPKPVKKIFTRCKQAVQLFTIGVMVYGVWATTTHVTPLSVIFSALMIVGWVLQILFEILFTFFINKAYFIYAGMEADAEALTKPIKNVGNFFKKVTGQEVEPPKPVSKERLQLDELVSQQRIERQMEKMEERASMQYAKQTAKENKRQAKQMKKAEKAAAKAERKFKKE